jgi:hypothetical protein
MGTFVLTGRNTPDSSFRPAMIGDAIVTRSREFAEVFEATAPATGARRVLQEIPSATVSDTGGR